MAKNNDETGPAAVAEDADCDNKGVDNNASWSGRAIVVEMEWKMS